MAETSISLQAIFDGWAGYNASLVGALHQRTPVELPWRPRTDTRSVGEVARHISLGRITWFARMDAPGSAEAAAAVPHWTIDIMAHDIHHGGELSLMLGQQGIEAFELSALGGHIVMPPLATATTP